MIVYKRYGKPGRPKVIRPWLSQDSLCGMRPPSPRWLQRIAATAVTRGCPSSRTSASQTPWPPRPSCAGWGSWGWSSRSRPCSPSGRATASRRKSPGRGGLAFGGRSKDQRGFKHYSKSWFRRNLGDLKCQIKFHFSGDFFLQDEIFITVGPRYSTIYPNSRDLGTAE